MEITKMVVSPEREQSGVWIDYDDQTKFLIGSVSSRRHKEVYQELFDDAKRKSRKITPEIADVLQIKSFARSIVLDWSGVTKEGAIFPCNPVNAEYVLKNCPQVREFVAQAAANYDNFKLEQVEEAKAQLGESSVGDSNTPPKM